MNDVDMIMHPLHFGTDPADIQIRINPATRIGISDDFWLKFALARFALSELSYYYYYYYYYNNNNYY